ncbi:MAG: triose-phosphate isomerase [Bacteroidales bacterium]
MRKKIVAGNWKMNTNFAEGEALVKELVEKKSHLSADVSLIVAPPFTHLACLAKSLENAGIGLAAQNCAEYEAGAYTGEISAKMLASIAVKYCILGHSERREYYGETNATLTKKVAQVFSNGITPIFCVGEKLDEREQNRHFEVVKQQLEVVCTLSPQDFSKVVIAYEPVWAIGTGKTASSEQAQEIHAYIRKVLVEKFGDIAQQTSILYGGSCKPSNAAEIFAQPDVDGGLIGGAALVADDFIAIAKAF